MERISGTKVVKMIITARLAVPGIAKKMAAKGAARNIITKYLSKKGMTPVFNISGQSRLRKNLDWKRIHK